MRWKKKNTLQVWAKGLRVSFVCVNPLVRMSYITWGCKGLLASTPVLVSSQKCQPKYLGFSGSHRKHSDAEKRVFKEMF